MVVNIKNSNIGFVERTATVKQYFSEVSKIQPLSIEEEKELFMKLDNIKTTLLNHFDSETNTYDLSSEVLTELNTQHDNIVKKIAERNQKFVISIARHYAPNDKFLDCVSEGTIGLMQAIEAFQLDRDVKFITFAVHYIRREITQYLRDDDPTIRKSNISKTFHTVAQARNEFIQREEREPSPEELAEMLNEKYSIEIKDLSDITDMRIISIDEAVSEDDDDTCVGDMQLFNDYSSSNNEYETTEANDYNKNMLSSLFSILTPREVKIISMSFGIGYDREYSPKEIGEEVGLTAERIRQMKDNIMKRLQNEFMERSGKI